MTVPIHVTPNDWPEDFSHENGQYSNICVNCGKTFVGHKRRFNCKACSKPVIGPTSMGDAEQGVRREIKP